MAAATPRAASGAGADHGSGSDSGADDGSDRGSDETVVAAGEAIVDLSVADVGALCALSTAAHWNQTAADWRAMLALGHGWGVRVPAAGDGHAVFAASAVALPWGADFGWVSMVLVLPDWRRRGLASRLLRHAIDALAAGGRAAVLDATPAGRAVYRRDGFVDAWTVTRWRRDPAGAAAPASTSTSTSTSTSATASTTAEDGNGVAVRRVAEADWPAIAALDASAFGADRSGLLRHLGERLPPAAHVAVVDGRIVGCVLGRDGRTASQIGPLVAADDDVAAALFGAAARAVPGPLVVDAVDDRAALRGPLEAAGFVAERPFTRMVRGRRDAPGDPRTMALIAGPELG